MKLLNPLVAALLIVVSFGASAQWQWIDKDGRKIFSDRGPGPDIPEKDILKRPNGIKSGNASPSAAPKAATDQETNAAATATPPVKDPGVDKNLEAKKKQAEAAEAAKNKAEDERIARMKAENCRLAKQSKMTYESGIRVARTTASGEREILDDAARAAELQRLQGIINSDCK